MSKAPVKKWTPQELLSQLTLPSETGKTRMPFTKTDTPHPRENEAEQVLTTPKFLEWLESQKPAKLLIHGNFNLAQTQRSPFSKLAPRMVQTLRPRVITLNYSCHDHLLDDSNSGGRTMITTLLNLLIYYFPLSLVELGTHVSNDDVKKADLNSLCSLFMAIVNKLPAQTSVICIIDGLDEIERTEHANGIKAVMNTLLYLTKGGTYVWFKLLALSHRSTTEGPKMFERDLLEMQQSSSSAKGGSFEAFSSSVARRFGSSSSRA